MDYAFAVRMLGAFAVIALVLFALQFVARAGLAQRLTASRGRRLINVLETTFLPNAASLHVVKMGDKYVVIGRSGSTIANLCELPPESVEVWLAQQSQAPIGQATLTSVVTRLRGKRPTT